MKHLSLLTFLFFYINSNVFAQSMLVEYYTVMEGIGPCKDTYIINDTLSVLKSSYSMTTSKLLEDLEELFFLKDKKNGFIYSKYYSFISDLICFVKDSIPDLSWELLPDTMTVLNQKCFAAKTHFRGRDYVAFYAPNIPMSDGPWKFGGLPGLILKVNSTDIDNATWIATRIETSYKEPIKIPQIHKPTYLSWSGFVKRYVEDTEKRFKQHRSSSPETIGVESHIKIPSVELIHPSLHTGKGAKF